MPNVFQNLVSCKRVFRELKMLCFFKHENVSAALAPTVGGRARNISNGVSLLRGPPQVLSALDILQPPHIDYFEEMYPLAAKLEAYLWRLGLPRRRSRPSWWNLEDVTGL